MQKSTSIKNYAQLRSIDTIRPSKGHICVPLSLILVVSSALRILVLVGAALRRQKKARFLIEAGY